MSVVRRSRRNPSPDVTDVPYVNVLLGGKLKNISDEMEYWDVVKQMGPYLISLPIIRQIGGSCVMYSIQTATQVADKEHKDAPVCSAKIKRDGAQMRQQLRFLKNKDGAKSGYNEYGVGGLTATEQLKCINGIIDALSNGNVVVAGGGPELCRPTKYSYPSKRFKVGRGTVANEIPVFNNFASRSPEHNICIIGCYNDKQEGPCFLTKMTNLRKGQIPSISIDGTRLKKENLSYGVLPIRNLQHSKLYLNEFASLPMAIGDVLMNLSI